MHGVLVSLENLHADSCWSLKKAFALGFLNKPKRTQMLRNNFNDNIIIIIIKRLLVLYADSRKLILRCGAN